MLALAVLHGAFALSGSRATVRPRTGLRMSGKPRRVLAELPFAQARAMARSMGMSSRDEWEEYSCPAGSCVIFTESLTHTGDTWVNEQTDRLSLFTCYDTVNR